MMSRRLTVKWITSLSFLQEAGRGPASDNHMTAWQCFRFLHDRILNFTLPDLQVDALTLSTSHHVCVCMWAEASEWNEMVICPLMLLSNVHVSRKENKQPRTEWWRGKQDKWKNINTLNGENKTLIEPAHAAVKNVNERENYSLYTAGWRWSVFVTVCMRACVYNGYWMHLISLLMDSLAVPFTPHTFPPKNWTF